MADKDKTDTPKVTKATETAETKAEVVNGSAITIEPVEGEPETRQVVYENIPKVVNGPAVSVKEGTVITVKTDDRNILQKGLDSITEVLTNIDGWLEDAAEEMADYDYGGWMNIFAEFGQGYAGRGGSFSAGRLLGCVAKGGEKLCYGICAGSVNLFSHPIQTAESLYKIPEGVKGGWNQFKDGNWTQRVEIATEAAGIAAMLVEAGVRIKNARNAGKASAEMEGILAEDAGAASGVEGAGASGLTEDMCRLVEEYKKLCEEEQWSMYKNTGCFPAGTKVSTPKGMRNIEEISVGEEVYAENIISGKPEKRKVTKISKQKTNTIVYLRIEESEIRSTMEHPFQHKEEGWVKAEELLPGDALKQRDGEYAEITYISQEKEEKEQWVYNLEVEGLHSYYVADRELLVHNGEGVCPSGNVKIQSAGKGSSPSKGHVATWEHLDEHGQLRDSGVSHSGGTKPGRILSWEEQLQTHTERKILDELSKKGTVSAGDTIIIYGTKPPCNPGRSMRPSRGCQKAMQDFARNNNVNILYFKEGDPEPWIFPR